MTHTYMVYSYSVNDFVEISDIECDDLETCIMELLQYLVNHKTHDEYIITKDGKVCVIVNTCMKSGDFFANLMYIDSLCHRQYKLIECKPQWKQI